MNEKIPFPKFRGGCRQVIRPSQDTMTNDPSWKHFRERQRGISGMDMRNYMCRPLMTSVMECTGMYSTVIAGMATYKQRRSIKK